MNIWAERLDAEADGARVPREPELLRVVALQRERGALRLHAWRVHPELTDAVVENLCLLRRFRRRHSYCSIRLGLQSRRRRRSGRSAALELHADGHEESALLQWPHSQAQRALVAVQRHCSRAVTSKTHQKQQCMP